MLGAVCRDTRSLDKLPTAFPQAAGRSRPARTEGPHHSVHGQRAPFALAAAADVGDRRRGLLQADLQQDLAGQPVEQPVSLPAELHLGVLDLVGN